MNLMISLFLSLLLTFNLSYEFTQVDYIRPVITRVPVIIVEKEEPELEEVIFDDELTDEEFLAQIIMAEAEGEDLIGMRLVGDVILNRVDHPAFPDTIKEVVYSPGQFEPMWTGRFEEVGSRISEQAYEAARLCLVERLDSEILYFATTPVNGVGFWQHGNHWFSY